MNTGSRNGSGRKGWPRLVALRVAISVAREIYRIVRTGDKDGKFSVTGDGNLHRGEYFGAHGE